MIFRTSQYHQKINQLRLHKKNKKQNSNNKRTESLVQQVINNIRNLISL